MISAKLDGIPIILYNRPSLNLKEIEKDGIRHLDWKTQQWLPIFISGDWKPTGTIARLEVEGDTTYELVFPTLDGNELNYKSCRITEFANGLENT